MNETKLKQARHLDTNVATADGAEPPTAPSRRKRKQQASGENVFKFTLNQIKID
jgi:hypothetical protein